MDGYLGGGAKDYGRANCEGVRKVVWCSDVMIC